MISVLSCVAHVLPHVRNTLVYDVSNRESFEALPRWLDELENYVPPEVVKIVVGNKLDKVSTVNDPSPFPPTYLLSSRHHHPSHLPLTRDNSPTHLF